MIPLLLFITGNSLTDMILISNKSTSEDGQAKTK